MIHLFARLSKATMQSEFSLTTPVTLRKRITSLCLWGGWLLIFGTSGYYGHYVWQHFFRSTEKTAIEPRPDYELSSQKYLFRKIPLPDPVKAEAPADEGEGGEDAQEIPATNFSDSVDDSLRQSVRDALSDAVP